MMIIYNDNGDLIGKVIPTSGWLSDAYPWAALDIYGNGLGVFPNEEQARDAVRAWHLETVEREALAHDGPLH